MAATAGPLSHTIDARWLMAYAAALAEEDDRYFDTEAPAGPLAHPLFPVCYEWPVAVALRPKIVDDRLAPLGVHASHRLVVHRAPRGGDRLSTTARVVALAARRAGALVVVRFDTVDADGAPVTTTDYGTVYRGVEAEAEIGTVAPPAPAEEGEVRWCARVDVPRHAARVYTEGARIWNPIHTDGAAARAAGLPAPILHGTATLALAVSRVVALDLGGDPRRVREVAARFTGMVPMPSSFVVRGRARDGDRIAFDAVAGQTPVLGGGRLLGAPA